MQIPVHHYYTGNTVRLEGYGYGSYWLTYVSCSHYYNYIEKLLLTVYKL